MAWGAASDQKQPFAGLEIQVKRNPPERVPDVGSLKAIYAGLRRIQPSAEQNRWISYDLIGDDQRRY
jgi:hypothetical protein